MKMETILLQLLLLNWALSADAECPFKLDYVRQLPWDKSTCESTSNEADCCQTLRSLIGVGFAQYLKDASVFEFPSNASAVSCLGIFQQQLDYLDLPPDLVSNCFTNISEFVSSPVLCAGIQTKQDWIRKVKNTSLESACKGDLSDPGACLECTQSGDLVTTMLADIDKNLTSEASLKCFYFTCLYAAGVVNEFGPENRNTAECILRLPFVQTTSDRPVLVYTFIGISVALVLICVLGLFYCLLVKKIDPKAVHRRFVRRNTILLKAAVKPNTGAVWFDIRLIRDATDNFSEANLIGQGGFGTVYRGTLPDARRIAVKRIRNCTPEGDSEFLNEVQIINSIRQRNLVVLRGCCVASDEREGHQRFLIYDYMPNGSLYDHLFGGMSKARPLSWPQRRNIVLGTAKGLAYLHDGIEPAIYHRDIKSTNILLYDEMNACVADFGLAKIMTKGEGEADLSKRIAGTHGYLAPEYALYGHLTDKNDVYSFGVLLLEIMSSRKAFETTPESASPYLIADWAWALVKKGRTGEIVDERIRQSGTENVMERFVLVGILCSHFMVAFRPRMVEALKMLEGEVEIPEMPDNPSPFLLHSLSVTSKRIVSDSHIQLAW